VPLAPGPDHVGGRATGAGQVGGRGWHIHAGGLGGAAAQGGDGRPREGQEALRELAVGQRGALFEPPVNTGEPDSAFTAQIAALVEAGRRRDAVEAFHRGIGVPDEIIAGMAPEVWAALEAVAHTLVYDCRLSDSMSLSLVGSVTVPTLVIDSYGSSGDLASMVAAVVEALPHGSHRSLTGEWHGVPHERLAPVLAGYLRGEG